MALLKFAHLADCHLGSWRQPELQELNFQSFHQAIDLCIQEKVDFILVSGDLFDSAYPPIEILKETFGEFKRIKEANIPVFMIAGSHDFSASGKTFLDVLEKAGFCTSVEKFDIDAESRIKLKPTLFQDLAIFGYSGKKSSMEIEDLKKCYFESLHPFSIFMIHTTIDDVNGGLMESIDKLKLPIANYYAMGHIHQVFEAQTTGSTFVYPGPIFPNNFQELADLKYGSFQLVTVDAGKIKTQNIKLKLKEVVSSVIELDNGLTATDKIIRELDKLNLSDKILLMKLTGTLIHGKTGDIRFNEIEEFVKKKGAVIFLKNTSAIKTPETEITLQTDSDNIEKIEEKMIEQFSSQNPADFNKFMPQLIHALSIEKNEDEKSIIYENRLIDDIKKILDLKEILL